MTNYAGEDAQYHCRYTPKNGDAGPYWTRITSVRSEAEFKLRELLALGYSDARLFERSLTPWAEVQP